MPRYKHYDYDQSLLLPVNFSEQIMSWTLEYTIHYVVEEKIDIAPLEERFCNEETGAPAYDPKILLKIILLAYSRGVNSTRRIEKLCKELYKAKDFTFNKKYDVLSCPNGKELRHERNQEWRKTAGRIYRSKKAYCKQCRLRDKCLKSEKTGQRSIYLVDSYFGRNYSEEMIKKIDTENGRHIYSRRMGIIEPVFAHICSAKGLNRFTLRTRAKVNIQWVLYCMVHNMEKICSYGAAV